MNESMDRELADWLRLGPEHGPHDGLERALAATRRVGQRPGWTVPERWLPMDMTLTRTPSQRPLLTIATLALLMVALVATAVFIGSQQRQFPVPPYRNGAIVFERDGDLFIADQLDGAPRPLVTGPDGDSDPAFSPRGDRIAFLRDGGRIMAVAPDGSDLTQLAIGLDDYAVHYDVRLGWAPDGSALLASTTWGDENNWALVRIDADGSRARRIDVGPGTTAGDAAWRPDGRHFAFLGVLGDMVAAYIADADGSNVRRLTLAVPNPWNGVAWSPDGAHLALATVDGAITVIDIDAGGEVLATRELSVGQESVADLGPSWSPDGRHIAVMLASGRVGIVAADGDGFRIVGPTVAPVSGSPRVAWAPDGRSLAITGDALTEDPDTRISSWTEKTWSIDAETGAATEVSTPVDSWQRLAPTQDVD